MKVRTFLCFVIFFFFYGFYFNAQVPEDLESLTGLQAAIGKSADPIITEMLGKWKESEIYDTALALQNFVSRVYGYTGNGQAAAYCYNRLSAIPGLTVEYQGGSALKNVIATLPGTDSASTEVYIVGAHYDCGSSSPANAPGATDNAAGVGIVMEYARILSQYQFKHTIKFACWNREEDGIVGSTNFATEAKNSGMNIKLYINYDSACYDPSNRYIHDIIYNSQSTAIKDMIVEHIATYKIGWSSITYNAHTCGGDYQPFWSKGFTAVSSHQETHGSHYHTPQDTVDKINLTYAKMNGQTGMSVLVRLAAPDSGPLPCIPNFEYQVIDTTVHFTDKSTNCDIVKWDWEFIKSGSIAGISTLQNPVFDFGEFGTFQTKFTITDNSIPPQTTSITKDIVISNEPPDPCASAGSDYSYFYFSTIKLGTLNNTSTGNGYYDYTGAVAAPQLKKGSSYTLTMTLNTGQYANWFKAYIDYNRDGDFQDSGEVIYVSAAAAKIQSDGGTITIPTTAGKGLTRLRVQVKNATSSNLPPPEPCETFSYGEVEDYYVNIIDDCSTPNAGFEFSVNQCLATFTNTSSGTDPIVSYSWTFGNGTGSTLANPTCTYDANGSFSVILTVTNSCGKSAAISKTVSITHCDGCLYDHLVGSFPNIGIWVRDSQNGSWEQLSKQQADIIRVGDINGNGIEDFAAYFKTTKKLWYRYDNGIWEDILASAATLVAFDLGDMNHDGREDLVGSWSDKGLWWRNNATGVWTKLSNMIPTYVAAADFDGDSKADVVGLFPSLNSIWIYYSTNTWKQISKQVKLVDLRAGNMDTDASAELVGSWDIGVWMFAPQTNVWIKHHSQQAKQIAVGDINGLCMQDVVGYWDADTPLYVKYMENNSWQKLSNYNPDTMDAGKVKLSK
jgi:hypothetical protein